MHGISTRERLDMKQYLRLLLVSTDILTQRRKKKRVRRLQIQHRREALIATKAQDMIERKKRIASLPIKAFTREEFDTLPQGIDVNLHECPIGTWFVCVPSVAFEEGIIVGQVVEGQDLFADQYGASVLSVPTRGINRYRVSIITRK